MMVLLAVVLPAVIAAGGLWLGYFFGRRQTVPLASLQKPTGCGNSLCSSRSDPRCAAGNCTYHCQSILGCHGRCLSAWVNSDRAGDIAREVLRKAKAER
jgi:hypothetical protein